ncbi:PA4780 family RIO1-like protein kinase [Acidiferrobacter sp.]|uniref:PA4780 family RIO1-like protein kinase n=1 Tax=Acidiferrobacter sp. TaxID=1872107 RepID=UPI002633135A|nr:PA4780 family RIO1-like protein kinase [Acidiferrobacter sp.]
MRIPKTLAPLLEDGLIDHVIQPLRSGKEADLFVVATAEGVRCAKVYKEARQRGFRQAGLYEEGRTVRDSRRTRAMAKRSRFGRHEREEIWQNAEVDALFRLADAGARVPKPYLCIDGVLLMELIVDAAGNPAPRLSDLTLTATEAVAIHAALMRDVARMLCAGIVHGDLSEYNVLLDTHGPVIIDLPQHLDAAANNNAAAFFVRDIDHLAAYLGRFAPALATTDYGREMWALHQARDLKPDTPLTGIYQPDATPPDIAQVLREIDAVRREEEHRQARLAARAEEGRAD